MTARQKNHRSFWFVTYFTSTHSFEPQQFRHVLLSLRVRRWGWGSWRSIFGIKSRSRGRCIAFLLQNNNRIHQTGKAGESRSLFQKPTAQKKKTKPLKFQYNKEQRRFADSLKNGYVANRTYFNARKWKGWWHLKNALRIFSSVKPITTASETKGDLFISSSTRLSKARLSSLGSIICGDADVWSPVPVTLRCTQEAHGFVRWNVASIIRQHPALNRSH